MLVWQNMRVLSILQRTIPELKHEKWLHFINLISDIKTKEYVLPKENWVVIYTHDSTESKWIYTMFEMRKVENLLIIR